MCIDHVATRYDLVDCALQHLIVPDQLALRSLLVLVSIIQVPMLPTLAFQKNTFGSRDITSTELQLSLDEAGEYDKAGRSEIVAWYQLVFVPCS